MEKRIRALAICPYEGMQSMLGHVSEEYPSLELNVVVGDLQKGVEAAQENFHADYDLIISRGGTARLLHEKVVQPVVEIPITEYDILRALHFAEGFSGPVAVVGFPNVTANARTLGQLLSVELAVFDINESGQVEAAVQQVWEAGYRVVLCDMAASLAAKQRGLNAILITSSVESVRRAFDNALDLCRNLQSLQNENHFFRELISGQSNEIVVFDEEKNLYFSTVNRENRPAVLEMLKKEIDSCQEGAPGRIVKSLDGMLYTIKNQRFASGGRTYTTFYFTRSKEPFSAGRRSIRYYTCSQAQQLFYDGFYSNTGIVAGLETEMEQINRSDRPVALLGEEGTGKESVATVLYTRNDLRNHPLVSINCALLNDKAWEYLQSNHNSPFATSESTIFISQLGALSQEQRRQLLAVLMDMYTCQRNRVILSFDCAREERMPEAARPFVDKLSCIKLNLPPLRQQSERIPTLINLYMNQLGISQVSSVLGMEPEAVQLMQTFPWPRNYEQFKRVLQDLVTMTTGSIITAEDTRRVLASEHSSPVAQSSVHPPERFSLDRPLAQIEDEIIRRVVAECGGNQSEAAKRLEISRSAIWRHLKR